jgi:MFS family permease
MDDKPATAEDVVRHCGSLMTSAGTSLTRDLRLLYLFSFLKNAMLFGAVTVPFYLEWAGLDYTRMFLLEGAYSLFMFLLEVPTGTIADRFGRKWSLVTGALFAGAAFMMFGIVRSYALFFVANFLCAVGATCISGADQALLYDRLLAAGRGDDGRRVLARYQAFGSAGIMIGFVLGSLLAGSRLLPRPRSLALVFLASGVVFLLAVVPMLFVHEPARGEKLRHPLREGWEGMRALLAPGELRRLALNYATLSATGFFMFWFYQSLAAEAAVPLAANGVLGAGLNLLGMLLLWKVATLEKRLGLSRLLLGSALVLGLGYLGLACFRPAVFALPAAFVIVGMKLLRAPLLTDLINRLVDSRRRATILSGVSMLERGVVFLLYPLVGLAADRSLSLAFAGLGAVSLLFALGLRHASESKASVEIGR